jgi:dipeptidyl aminopeptidase/acylaminoacyl peptidase
VRPPHGFVANVRWSPDGSALSYEVIQRPRLRCGSPRYGLGLLAAGMGPRPLLALSGAEPSRAIWSPDGRRLAVKLEPDWAADVERRGKRHPWPKHIRREYGMFSRRGDAAIRRIVVRAARALRRGASREATMRLVSIGYERVAKRYSEAEDSVVGEALAVELSKWLRAAGFEEIDGLDELDC